MYLNPILRYGKVAGGGGGGLFIGGGVLVCKSYGEINKVNSKIEVSSYFATPPIPPPPTPRIRVLKIDQKKAGVFGQGFGLIQNLNQKKQPTIYSRDLQNSYSSGDVGLVHST